MVVLSLELRPHIDNICRFGSSFHRHLPCDGGTFSVGVGSVGPECVLLALVAPVYLLIDLITARFVPFAIFVCSASLFIFFVL